MGWFTCKVCIEKDKRIEDFKAMLATQTKLLKEATSKEDPVMRVAINGEMNRIMDGGGPQIELTSEQQLYLEAVEREKQALLSGTY